MPRLKKQQEHDDNAEESSSQHSNKMEELEKQRETKVQYARPYPRDGHIGLVFYDTLLVFGGDRHKHSFDDIYMLDLQTCM